MKSIYKYELTRGDVVFSGVFNPDGELPAKGDYYKLIDAHTGSPVIGTVTDVSSSGSNVPKIHTLKLKE